ncbi:unnamed protein product [Adineta ricciae]|uniref:Uncharacterized protein n=1 Tax=Adineta ricciae TaxID=249248 RepID=A0A814ZWE7_ADIRI|nr:unnamed protein product [Adineta ricciae]CAF1560816.1 unnamed protein product [Adineta ricciae]
MHTLFRLVSYLLVQRALSRNIFERNETASSTLLKRNEDDLISPTLHEDLTSLDHYFFSYDVIDHVTILIKFDITRTFLFRKNPNLYNAHVYISKLPSMNYKIDISPFTGYYEKEIRGSINDHFTFCLVLTPNLLENLAKTNLRRNRSKPISNHFLMGSSRKQQQHIIHYCTRMDPDEYHSRHHVRQGSEGDRILLVLQLMMIAILLAVLQIVHVIRNRKRRDWRLRRLSRIRRELLRRKEYIDMPNETLAMLRFATIIDKESHDVVDDPEKMLDDNDDEEEEEDNDDDEEKVSEEKEKEDSPFIPHQRILTRRSKYQRTRSLSPHFDEHLVHQDMCCAEHILRSKPWHPMFP